MLKTEVDIMTKTEHPNVYAPLPRARAKPPTPEAVHTRLSAERARRLLTRRAMRGSVKLYKVHETTTVLYLVMELLTGGELFDRIVARGHYSEDDARKLTVVMLKAVLSPSPRNTRTIPHPGALE
jgi:serine/threonine protein kinase